jgi:phosphonate transport system substrate-binding protein
MNPVNRIRALSLVAVVLVAGVLAGITTTPARMAGAAESGVISLGSISRTPKEEVATFQPFADYLARRLRAEGIQRGRVVVAGSMLEMVDLMKRAEVDIFIDSPFPVTVVMQGCGAQPFLRRWKKGKPDYHSVIFVRRDSGIDTLNDLKGKLIAFDEPSSTSGYLLPKATLVKAGLRLTELSSHSESVPRDRVGYVFAKDDENTVFWLLRKRVSAGVLSNLAFEKLLQAKSEDVKVLARTIDVPRHVVAHRPNLAPPTILAIADILVAMDQDREGKTVLEKFEATTKFDRFPQGAIEAFRPIETLVRLVEHDLRR